MRWLPIEEIKTVQTADARSRIVIHGLSAEVSGIVLEGAVALDTADPMQGYLIFLTHDIPFEDTLSISLLDNALRLTDRAWLGGMYTTGSWRAPQLDGRGRVSFDFFGDHRWQLQVLPAPEMRLPFSEPRGVHRPFGWSRRFRVSSQTR